MTQVDPRRLIPRTDQLLALAAVEQARIRLGERAVKAAVRDIQDQARRGDLPPEQVQDALVASLTARTTTTLRPVLNATGVVVHTNLGRAPLAPGTVEARTSPQVPARSAGSQPAKRCWPPARPPRTRSSSTTGPLRWCSPPPRWQPETR